MNTVDSLFDSVAAIIDNNNTLKMEDFLNVRSDPENKKGFFHFFDIVVTSITGKRKFSAQAKVSTTISGSGFVTVSDEAFAEVVVMNYWDRWFNKRTAKWTDACSSNI